MRKNEVVVDLRGRVNLNQVRTQKHLRYLATEDPDGAIHLVPAVLVPARICPPENNPALDREMQELFEGE
jgi:hypothetical protein